MTDSEIFDSIKRSKLGENEEKYGREIRGKYGEEAVNSSNERFMRITEAEYAEAERLAAEIKETLAAAVGEGDPTGETAQRACGLHRRWLELFYPNYCAEYHLALADMYVEDSRFRAYYDDSCPGAAAFLRDAITVFVSGDCSARQG